VQAEIDTVHARCRMLEEEGGVGIGSSAGATILGEDEHESEREQEDGRGEGAAEVEGLDGSPQSLEDDASAHHSSQESHNSPGEDAACKISAQVAELDNRIVVLTEQLEAALRDEEFDLCDSLNAEITAVTEQKDALLQ
jgi:hypothetical protein